MNLIIKSEMFSKDLCLELKLDANYSIVLADRFGCVKILKDNIGDLEVADYFYKKYLRIISDVSIEDKCCNERCEDTENEVKICTSNINKFIQNQERLRFYIGETQYKETSTGKELGFIFDEMDKFKKRCRDDRYLEEILDLFYIELKRKAKIILEEDVNKM